MGVLSNQARLLAAQAFNRKVLEDKARAKQAEIEAERREALLRTTRRLELAKASARNIVERQRIQDAINERLRSQTEIARRAKINAEAKRESARVFTRVAKGSNIGVLTGFQAKKDSRGRTIGISRNISKTRKRTITLLKTEIARQQKIAREGTDLERFLRNEQAINQGRVSSAELRRQIRARKARGLSQTPAQKRASQFFRDSELRGALARRSSRKGRPKLRATFGTIVSERARAGGLGSSPFIDPLFAFGGRTKKEVIARGGTFGRRAGGESISTQLSFISQAKSRSTSGRINFAQGLLANLDFSGSSQQSLLGIVGNKKIKTPKTFQAELREGVGFFTTEAIPVTKPKLSRAGRQLRVAQRKAEDFAKTEKARTTIARQAESTRQPIFNLASFGRQLDVSNLQRGRAIERQNVLAPPRFPSGDFSLGGITVQRQQAPDPTQISLIQQREFIGTSAQIRQKKNQALAKAGLTPSQIRQVNQGVSVANIGGSLTPPEKRAIAKQVTKENKALREQGGGGLFGSGGSFGQDDLEGITGISGLVTATGVAGTRTTTTPRPSEPQSISIGLEESLSFADSLGAERVEGNIFDVSLSETIGIADTVRPKRKKAKKTTRVSSRGALSTPRSDFDIFNIDLTFGTGEPVGRPLLRSLSSDISSGISGGVADFFSLESLNISQGARVGDVEQGALDREILKNLGFGF